MSDSFNLKFVIFSFLYFYHQLEQALKKLTLLVWLQQCLPQTYTSPAHIFPSGLDILAWRRYDMHIDTLFRIRYIWNTIKKKYHLLHGCHAITESQCTALNKIWFNSVRFDASQLNTQYALHKSIPQTRFSSHIHYL